MRKTNEFINRIGIIKIVVHDFEESYMYYYLPERKGFLGLFKKGAGVYFNFFGVERYTEKVEKLPDDLVLIDGVVYEKPCVTVYLVDTSYETFTFDTLEQAYNFKNELTKNNDNWVDLR